MYNNERKMINKRQGALLKWFKPKKSRESLSDVPVICQEPIPGEVEIDCNVEADQESSKASSDLSEDELTTHPVPPSNSAINLENNYGISTIENNVYCQGFRPSQLDSI